MFSRQGQDLERMKRIETWRKMTSPDSDLSAKIDSMAPILKEAF